MPAEAPAAPAEARLSLEPSWRERVGDYLQRPDMRALADFLRQEKSAGKRIYPAGGRRSSPRSTPRPSTR